MFAPSLLRVLGVVSTLALAACQHQQVANSARQTTAQATPQEGQKTEPFATIAPPEKLRQAAEALAREDWFAAQDLSRATLQEAHATLAQFIGKDPLPDSPAWARREQAQLFLLYALITLGEVWHSREDCVRATVPLTRAVVLWRAGGYSERTLTYADLLARRASCAVRLGDAEVRAGAGQDLAFALTLTQAAEARGGAEALLAQPIIRQIAQASLWLAAHNGAVEVAQAGLVEFINERRVLAETQGEDEALFRGLIFAAEVHLLLARSARHAEASTAGKLAEENYLAALAPRGRRSRPRTEAGAGQTWFALVRLHRAALEVYQAQTTGAERVARHGLALAEVWQGYADQEGLSQKSRESALRTRSQALQTAAFSLAVLDQGQAVREVLQEAVESLVAVGGNRREESDQLRQLKLLLRTTQGDDTALLEIVKGAG